MTRWAWYLIAIALLALPNTGFAQTKPTYSDSGKVEGVFAVRDEGCEARCAADSQCVEKCPSRRLIPEELRAILRPASPDRH